MKKIILSSSFVIMLAGALIMFTGTGCAHAYHGYHHTSVSMGFDNGYFMFNDHGHGHHNPHYEHRPPPHGHAPKWHGHDHHKPAPQFHGHGHHGQPPHGNPRHAPHHGHGGRR